jgi:hypothetical protein
MLISILLMLILVIVVSFLWAEGIDYMKKNHPNYKGEDFLS